MLKAVIFDLNGVLIQGQKLSDRFWNDFQIPKEEFLPALKDVLSKARLSGAEKVFSRFEPYLKKWNINFTEKELLEYWFNAEKIVPEMLALAQELHTRGIKVFILSNNFKERTEYYKVHDPEIFAVMDKVYFSWEVGFKKSDSRIYQLLLQENNLQPEECIYIDDQEENVALARTLGMQAYIFKDAPGARAILL